MTTATDLLTCAGQIKLYCKGADSVIYPRLAGGQHARYADATLSHLELFACDGLRTLVFASADISEQFYQVSFFTDAATSGSTNFSV